MSHMLCTGYFYKGGGGCPPPLKLSNYKGVFKGGSGALNPPQKIFQTFVKSEGKEVERKKNKKGWEGLIVNIFLGVEIFLSGVEIFLREG